MKKKLYLKRDDDEFDGIILTADLEEKEIWTNCGDHYYDYTISIDQFLEFADFIRANLHANTDGRWENVGELFEREEE